MEMLCNTHRITYNFSSGRFFCMKIRTGLENESKRLPACRDINKMVTDRENAEYHWSANYPAKRALLAGAG